MAEGEGKGAILNEIFHKKKSRKVRNYKTTGHFVYFYICTIYSQKILSPFFKRGKTFYSVFFCFNKFMSGSDYKTQIQFSIDHMFNLYVQT